MTCVLGDFELYGEEKDHLLLEAWVILIPRAEGRIQAGHGQRMMAAFLDRIREKDPAMAGWLHDCRGEKPFTVSFLQGDFCEPEEGTLRVSPEKEYRFRFTSVHPELSDLVMREVIPDLKGKELRIGDVNFMVRGCQVRQETLEDLYRRHLLAVRPPRARWALRFESPTAFRSRGRNHLIPEPRFVLLSLNKSWSSISRIDLGKDLHLLAEKDLFIARYDLRTNILHFDRFRQVGFTGFCEYQADSPEEWRLKVYRMLFDFSRYSGVGIKRTMGMGQVEPILSN